MDGEGPFHGDGPLGFVLLRLGWTMGLGEHIRPDGKVPHFGKAMAYPGALIVPPLPLPSGG